MARLDELSVRITTLDEKRIQDKEDILLQIETTGRELKQILAEFKVLSYIYIYTYICICIYICIYIYINIYAYIYI
jgi:hypothetical protein